MTVATIGDRYRHPRVEIRPRRDRMLTQDHIRWFARRFIDYRLDAPNRFNIASRVAA